MSKDELQEVLDQFKTELLTGIEDALDKTTTEQSKEIIKYLIAIFCYEQRQQFIESMVKTAIKNLNSRES